MPQVIGIGEVMVDFVAEEPVSYLKASGFKKFFGGAPMNTIVGISRLGVESGAITAVGDDSFGRFLIDEMKKNGVDVSYVAIKKGVLTTICFVADDPVSGEKTEIFYHRPWVRDTSAITLTPKDIPLDYIAEAEILHVSGFPLCGNPSRGAVLKAVKYAKEKGTKVSFDPTLRFDVWNSKGGIKRMYQKILQFSDIATFSTDEASFLFETSDTKKAAEKALKYGLEIVGIKMGSKGAYLKTDRGLEILEPAFKVKPVDTTGAGDGWNAGLLVGLIKRWDLKKCVKVANAIGALVVTKYGAITALPSTEELNHFLEEQSAGLRI